jgi:hypothetical protein
MVTPKALRVSGTGHVKTAAKQADVHRARVHEAILVLDYAPDLADAIITGEKPLDAAGEEISGLLKRTI